MNRPPPQTIRHLLNVVPPSVSIPDKRRSRLRAALLAAFERMRRDENGRPRLSGGWR